MTKELSRLGNTLSRADEEREPVLPPITVFDWLRGHRNVGRKIECRKLESGAIEFTVVGAGTFTASQLISSSKQFQELYSAIQVEIASTPNPGYTGDPPSSRPATPPEGMTDDTGKNRVIARVRKLPPSKLAALEKLLDDFEAAEIETMQPRPKWPDDALPHEIDSPPHFAARAFKAEANARILHRGLIGQEDRARGTKLAGTLSNWLRTHNWPEDVPYIPTKPEWMTRQVEAAKKQGKPLRAPRSDEAKLRDAARYRAGKISQLL